MSNSAKLELKLYQVNNRATGEKHYAITYDADEAIKRSGWFFDDCFVVDVQPKRHAIPRSASALMVQIPCDICPFRYLECKKPSDAICPVQPTAPELQEWLKQAAGANQCSHHGQELNKGDYLSRLKWLSLADAIMELSSKP